MSNFSYFSESRLLKHSLATPITNILLNAQLASQTIPENLIKPNYFHHLDQILISAKYLSSIVKLADETHPEFTQTFYVKNALLEIIKIAKKPFSTIRVVSHLNLDHTIRLKGNKLYFQEAIVCFLNNACEAYRQTARNKTILIICSVNQNTIQINISDGGQGISWLEKQKIFLANYSRKKDHMGVGINFAKNVICKHFLGNMKIISNRNKGTTICISLPYFKNFSYPKNNIQNFS